MSELMLIIGGVAVLIGSVDLLSFGDDEDNKDWKKPVLKIVGGAVVAGIGVLMKYFGT